MADSIQDLRAKMPEGMTIQHTFAGQWRVNFRGGSEDTAYYADDPQDAIETAKAMHARKQGEPVKVIRPVLTHDEAQALLAMTAIGMAFTGGHPLLAVMLASGATQAEWKEAAVATKKLMQLVDPAKFEELSKKANEL